MKVTDLLVNCLEHEGVEYVFGIVGKETIDLAESLSKSKKIKFVNVRHEQGAAFMADVYGRLSKKAGVCFSTLGPGATNHLTGISSALLDHSPVVALIGQAGLERHHKESHQYLDLLKIFEPATKWSSQIEETQTIPTVIRKAFKTATMEKPGSVAIILPENVADQDITTQPLPISSLPESVPTSDTINMAMTLVQKCSNPFILVGNGVFRQDAVTEFRTFVEKLQAPVTNSFMAKGVLPKEHPLNYFTFGFNENDEVLVGINEAELLIVVGFDFVEKLPKDWNKNKLPILHIDTLPAEINDYYTVKAELVGNIKKTLHLLNQAELPVKRWQPNIPEKTVQSVTQTITLENILQCIEQITSENTIVISDVGSHKISIARHFHPKRANSLIISNGLASMGIAIPGSIGAKLACPDDTVICVTGDGGALMNFAEIETAKRLGLNFILIVLKDSMLKLEVQQMTKKFGESFGVTFDNPNFVQLAESFGIKGRRAENIEDVKIILRDSLEELVLIEVQM